MNGKPENGNNSPEESRTSWRTRMEIGQQSIRDEVKAVSSSLRDFIAATDRRHQQHDTEIDRIGRELAQSGKTNWPALGVMFTIVGGLAVLYIAPVKTAQDATDRRLEIQATSLADNIRRIEENRRADAADMDNRLQREMRMLTDTVNTKFDANKEYFIGRLMIDERRTDDVTARVDEWNSDERRELHRFWSGAAMSNRTTQP